MCLFYNLALYCSDSLIANVGAAEYLRLTGLLLVPQGVGCHQHSA